MSMTDRDFIHREIRRLAQALARVGRARNREDGQEDARRELDAAEADLLGPLKGVLPRVDDDSALALLGNGPAAWTWACLLHERALLDGDAGMAARALRLGRRALSMGEVIPGAREELARWEVAVS